MSKCPKCGVNSTEVFTKSNVNGIMVCAECWYKQRKELSLPIKEKEPTTAEKLLWLVEQQYAIIPYQNKWGFCSIRLEISGRVYKPFAGETLEEALDAAYSWAKEQEK